MHVPLVRELIQTPVALMENFKWHSKGFKLGLKFLLVRAIESLLSISLGL